MIIYQHDHAGVLVAPMLADPSPLEPGVYLIPARCVAVAPVGVAPAGKVQRWNGAAWDLVTAPTPGPAPADPVAKLQAFLDANPDVAALIG
jgi:hypothetical protein